MSDFVPLPCPRCGGGPLLIDAPVRLRTYASAGRGHGGLGRDLSAAHDVWLGGRSDRVAALRRHPVPGVQRSGWDRRMLTPDEVRAMTPDEIRERYDEVQAAMAAWPLPEPDPPTERPQPVMKMVR